MPNPSVSIIITNYNYADYVGDAIDSSLGQDWPDIEVVVIDDGSTDNSWKVISTYDDRITAIRQQNSGQLASTIKGCSLSRGRFIIFLDSDDRLAREAVREVVNRFETDPGIVMVTYRLRLMDGVGNPLDATAPPRRYALSQGDLAHRMLTYGPGNLIRPPTSGIAFRREAVAVAFERLDRQRHCPVVDDYLCAVVPLLGKVSAIQVPLGDYRVHGRNRSICQPASLETLRRASRKCETTAAAAHTFIVRSGLVAEQSRWVRPWHVALQFAERKLAGAPSQTTTRSLLRLYREGLGGSLFAPFDDLARRLTYMIWFTLTLLLPRRLARPLVARLVLPGGYRSGVDDPAFGRSGND